MPISSPKPSALLFPLLLLILLWGIGITIIQIQPNAFRLTLNPYAALSALSAVANLIILFRLSLFKVRDLPTITFSLVVGSLTIWSVSECLQRLSATIDGYIFWDSVQALGWVTVPVAFLLFTLSYVRSTLFGRSTAALFFLITSTVFFLFIGMNTGLIDSHNPDEYMQNFWGFDTPVHPLLGVFMMWLGGQFIISFALLISAYRSTVQPAKKKQIWLITAATFIPFFGGSITDGILPAFGFQIMPIAVLLTSVMAAIITYAMIRYNLLRFNPATAAAAILDTMQEAVIVVNPNYFVEYANRKAESLLGRTQEDLVGMSLNTIFARSYGDVKRRLLLPLRTEEFTKINESHVTDRRRHKLPVSLSAARISEEEIVHGYVIAITDITTLEQSYGELEQRVKQIRKQNKELESLSKELRHEKHGVEIKVEERTQELNESHAQLLASINSLQLGFIMTDQHGKVTLLNTAARNILFTSKKDLTSLTIEAVEEQLESVTGLREQLALCRKEKRSMVLQNVPHGTQFLTTFINPIVLDGKVLGVVILVQDITEAKVLERTRDEFFTIASHELRTPITAVLGYADLLQSLYVPKLQDPQMGAIVERIEEGGHRLIKIVNDFLSASLLEQGKLGYDLSDFDIVQLLTESCAQLASLTSTKGLDLHLEDKDQKPIMVRADRDKVKQVVTNLVGNAAKFTTKGGIAIDVDMEKDRVIVRVHDTGPGIPAENQHLLFRKFQQAGSSLLTRDASHGTGIGLYISKLMVEGMNGGLYLESSHPKRGSTFTFYLPLP